MGEVLMTVRSAWVENPYDEKELARKGLAFPKNESVKEMEMDKEAAEIVASAIRAVGREIGTGDAATSMGGLEIIAMEMKEGSTRIADAINNLAEAIRERD